MPSEADVRWTSPERNIVNPVDPNASPKQKAEQLAELTKENKPIVDDFIEKLDADLGTRSKSNIKKEETII